MVADRFTVIQGVYVQSVSEGLDCLDIALEGPEISASSIVFRIGDERERRRSARTLARWRRWRTPLTYVRAGTTNTLLNERDLLKRALR